MNYVWDKLDNQSGKTFESEFRGNVLTKALKGCPKIINNTKKVN